MTPSQLEHLKRIDAHLERLLEIASKRTPGEWIIGAGRYLVGLDSDTVEIAEFSKDDDWEIEQRSNMKFIAAAAGNAEAGWRATRAAIAFLEKYNQIQWGWDGDCGASEFADTLTESLLAAFPLESLKP